MATEVQIPSFNFAAFFYPDILEALILFKRRHLPELTDESEFETTIQLLRAFALVGHLNNVIADLVANESTLPTAKLPETVRNMLRLIDYEMRPAAPGSVEVLLELSRVFSVSKEIVPARAQFATRRAEGDLVTVYFEALSSLTITRSDQLTAVFDFQGGSTWNDKTTEANAGTNWTFTPGAGKSLYFGHAEVQHNRLDIEVTTPTADIVNGVWEFYDGSYLDAAPDSVTNVGGGVLKHVIDGLLGTQNRSGATVQVQLNETTVAQVVTSQWDGSNNYVETGLLGQTMPSTTAADYTVGVRWQELDGVEDDTSLLSVSGTNAVKFTLPQDELRSWESVEVNSTDAYWLRFRVIEVSGVSAATLAQVRMDQGDQYVIVPTVQGRSIIAETLGSSNGDANQRFDTANESFVAGSATLRVDSVEWTQVDNFLSSEAQDKHYVVELGDKNRATIVFGDGTTGKIPDIGQGNIELDYRFGVADDGNVGARTVTVDKTGLSFINSLTNPRQGTGWVEAQSDSDAGIEQAKIAGPASLRIIETALSPDDIVDMTLDYTDANGSRPFVRALAIEEAFGEKTVGIVVVTAGGGLATATQLDDLSEYFNGNANASPPVRKRLVANQEATALNYTPRTVDITAIVEAPSEVTAQAVVNQLASTIQPEATQINQDGAEEYVWNFGDKIPVDRIVHEIFKTDTRITDVDLSTPSSDIQLGARELPALGTVTVTVSSSI